MKQLWLTAKLDIVESLRARWFSDQASRGLIVALTRSSRGATILEGTQRWDIPAAPAREVDPTGAGDVFGIALTVSLAGMVILDWRYKLFFWQHWRRAVVVLAVGLAFFIA